MADEGLDYDDLISQNILIRREEKEDKTATVEVLTKQSDDYENLYQKQAEIYHMDVDLQGYLKTSLGGEGSEEEVNHRSDDSSDYEVVVKPTVKRDLSPDYDEQDSSSDSDWEVTRKPKTPKGVHQCDECDKKCATKHGLLMHKRSHERQKLKMRKEETPPPPPVFPSATPPASPDHAQLFVQVEMGGGKEEEKKEGVEQEDEDEDEEEEEEEGKVEEQKGSAGGGQEEEGEGAGGAVSPAGNGETPEEEDDDDDEDDEEEEEAETDLNG